MIFFEILINLILKLGLFFIVIYINILAGALLLFFLKRSALNYFNLHNKNMVIFREILKKILGFTNAKVFSITSYITLGYGIILPVVTTFFYGYPFGYYYSVYQNEFLPSNYLKAFSFLFSLIFEFILILFIRSYPSIIFWSSSIVIDLLIINTIFIVINVIPIFPSLVSFFVIEHVKSFTTIIIYKNLSIVFLFLMFLINLYAFIINKVVYFSYNVLVCMEKMHIYIFLFFLISLFISFLFILRNKVRIIIANKINKTLSLYKEVLEKIKNIENKEV